MSDYTPRTENVRLGYSYRPNLPEGERHHPPLLAEFDRWLAEHDAELLERAARVADFQGHIWSGAPSQSFFWVADKIRELKETT